MKYVVCYSGGHSSALAAIETVRKFGRKNVILLNHNISSKVEVKEIKEFKTRVAEYLRLPITYANCEDFEKKTPLSLCMKQGTFRFRTGREICTYYLKTQPFYQWMKENYPVSRGHMSTEVVLVYGFNENETHRIARRRKHLCQIGYQSIYPLVELPRTLQDVETIGIERPSIYLDSKHANCIGCLKAGKQHWYKVYCCHRDIFEEGKMAEAQIGYSIIKGSYLKDLEQEFEQMKLSGVPATENMESYWFWNYARR